MTFDVSQSAYRSLRGIVAERTNPVLAWVGSGLSIPAGLPSWAELRVILLDELLDKAKGLDGKDREQLEARVRQIRLEPNNWVAFSMLRDELGQATYRDTVRDAFAGAATAEIPDAYRKLWGLGVRGILNLNIDRLATRAWGAHKPGAQIGEYNGNEVRDIGQILSGRIPFVVNLHGSIESTRTWVFTRKELSALTRNDAYRTFIDVCLSTRTVLFLGLSVDDVAVGGHLRRLADAGIETGPHFWLTDRGDVETDQWAEEAGIRRIRYRSPGEDHSEVDEFFLDLETYVSPEPTTPLPPVALDGPTPPDGRLPAPEELERLDAESIRSTLNAHAKQLLLEEKDESYADYQRFAEEYEGAIYRAWYTSARPGSNKLLGYTLEADIARGAFGHVYRATDPDGKQVAVKVLLEEVRRDPGLLRTFRRGVHSMRILRGHDVSGMVAYLEASEIPAFVVMEWIDGPNLTQAREGNMIGGWEDLLKIGSELALIIRSAHILPERVLHRDIRPSNVMLSGFYGQPNEWEVVVLDFDLSWHRGAYEQSVLHTTSGGFLAPEQIRHVKDASTRNAAVDAFGIGMTLYYLCSGEEPLSGQHRNVGWEEQVRTACAKFSRTEWKSIPVRIARLILAATQDEQASRWDLAEIAGELTRLRAAAEDPGGVTATELLAEELAANCEGMQPYDWDPDRLCARHEQQTGLKIEIAADIKEQRVRLSVSWQRTGAEDRTNVGKYIVTASKAMDDQLKAGGWKTSRSVDRSSMHFEAALEADVLRGDIATVAERVDAATEGILRFNR
ncbi:MAG TPA: SIR2 family protein [Solirubrobacterales bacterium]|nr:SIR2 family protein [Solirubrobacterales bacterium]